MLDGTRSGGDVRAFKQLLAARLLAETPDEGALYDAVVKRRTTSKLIETHPVWDVAFSPDGQNVVTGRRDCTLRLWDVHTGAPLGAPLTGHTAP